MSTYVGRTSRYVLESAGRVWAAMSFGLISPS
jgi:hypothetical protein